MILVDTSAWIDFFRGKGKAAPIVDELVAANEVALCGPVIIELRRVIRSDVERSRVMSHLDGCELLSQPDDLWTAAGELGAFLRKKGANVKSFDLLIAAYALAHSVSLLAVDTDFATMKRCGVRLTLHPTGA